MDERTDLVKLRILHYLARNFFLKTTENGPFKVAPLRGARCLKWYFTMHLPSAVRVHSELPRKNRRADLGRKLDFRLKLQRHSPETFVKARLLTYEKAEDRLRREVSEV